MQRLQRLSAAGSMREQAHLLYLILAIPSFFLLLIAYPNFQAPDDPDHFKRASTLFDQPFQIITPEGRSSGAMVDAGLKLYADEQFEIARRPDMSSQVLTTGPNRHEGIHWLHRQEFSEMPGAVSYLPLVYAPQSAAIAVGKALGLTVNATVFLGRIANGLAAILLTWLGLLLLPRGHAFVLALLLLPRTMLQYASNSADPLLFGLTLLVIALALRPEYQRKVAAQVIPISLFVAAAVRPPLAALAMLPVCFGLAQRRMSMVLLSGGAVLSAAAWTLWSLPKITDNRCAGAKAGLLDSAVAFALESPKLMRETLAEHSDFYLFSLIGHYGYADGPGGTIAAPMPMPIYSVAILLLGWAIRLDLAEGVRLPRSARILLLSAAALMLLVTFFAMYVACTAAGSSVVAGVQGRYFIPAFFALAPAMAGSLGEERAWPLRPFMIGLVLWVSACLAVMLTAAPDLYRL